jgi:hypothetical protein
MHTSGKRKSMKITQGKSEAVNRRKDNSNSKRKRTKGDLQNTARKIKIEQSELQQQLGLNSGAPKW